MNSFTTDINLDGLVAKYETEFEYANKVQTKHTQMYEFAQFNGKRGIFVFEFIGNGISSRAIIQKGNLSLIYKDTIAGQFAYILDED